MPVVDYEDLQFYALELLQNYPEIRQKLREVYRYVMVDEFQDTNAHQRHFLRLLAPEPGKLGTGMIVDLPLLADTAPDLLGQSLTGFNTGSDVGKQGHLPLQTAKQALDPGPFGKIIDE